MDLFKFHNPTSPTKFESGQIINGVASFEWIDRYAEAGEVTIVSEPDARIQDILSPGSFVGLTGNQGIMRVDSVLLKDGSDSEIVVKGRSLESFLEHRVVGTDLGTFPHYTGARKFKLDDAVPSWTQAVWLIKNHVQDTYITYQTNDEIPDLEVWATVTGLPETQEFREIGRKTVYSALMEILEVDNCGIRVIRPGPDSPASDKTNVAMVIHRGVDRQTSVEFAWDSNEIVSSERFMSDKETKNVALITGKWVELLVGDLSKTGYDRRVMFVDGTDIDQDNKDEEGKEVAPTGDALTWIVAAMTQRAKAALKAQRTIDLAGVELNKESSQHIYGRDYDIGDIVSVRGNYQVGKAMRVTEYAYIKDENGVTSYPTLSDIETEND